MTPIKPNIPSPLLGGLLCLALAAPPAAAAPANPTPASTAREFRVEAIYAAFRFVDHNILEYRLSMFPLLGATRNLSPAQAIRNLIDLRDWFNAHPGAEADGTEPLLLAYWELIKDKGNPNEVASIAALLDDLTQNFRYSTLRPEYLMPVGTHRSPILVNMPATLVRDMVEDLIGQIRAGMQPDLAGLLRRHHPCLPNAVPASMLAKPSLQEEILAFAKGPGCFRTKRPGGGGGGGASTGGAGDSGMMIPGGLGACLNAAAVTSMGGEGYSLFDYLSDQATCANGFFSGPTIPYADGGEGNSNYQTTVETIGKMWESYLKSEGKKIEEIRKFSGSTIREIRKGVDNYITQKMRNEDAKAQRQHETAKERRARHDRYQKARAKMAAVLGYAKNEESNIASAEDTKKRNREEWETARYNAQSALDRANDENLPMAEREFSRKLYNDHLKAKSEAESWMSKARAEISRIKKTVLEKSQEAADALGKTNQSNNPLNPGISVRDKATREACERAQTMGRGGPGTSLGIPDDNAADPRVYDPAPDADGPPGGANFADMSWCGSDPTTFGSPTACAQSMVALCADEAQCACLEKDEGMLDALSAKRAAAQCNYVLCPDGAAPRPSGLGCACDFGGAEGGGHGPIPVPAWNADFLNAAFLGRPTQNPWLQQTQKLLGVTPKQP